MNVRDAIAHQPMRPFQLRIVFVCILIAMVDGYEILAMAFVAPHIAKAWSLGIVEVGYLLSAGIFGTAIGAFFVSPLADNLGRRRHIVFCLALITVGMLLSAMAQNVLQLIAFRAIAGIFLGAILSSINILVSEYSSNQRRGTVMGIYGIGLNLGAAIGGALTNTLIAAYSWRGPFVFGALVTALMLVVAWLALPESVDYLIEKRPKNALPQYNALARRLGLAAATALPAALESSEMLVTRKALFQGVMLPRTLALWIGYACVVAAFYFANSWTPKLMADAAGNVNLGARTGVLMAVGGILSALLFAALSLRFHPRRVTIGLMVGGAVVFLLYADNYHQTSIALWLAVAVGMVANGGNAAFYAISPVVFPATARGAGVGLMIGMGRTVAIVVPVLTGYLLRAGWTPQGLYQFFAGFFGLASVAIFVLDRTYRSPRRPSDGTEPPVEALLPEALGSR